MRFCPWYALADAAAHAPGAPGVLQLRLVDGLLDYPRGKSAMVHYAHADDVRAAAVALAASHANRTLLCRHVELEHAAAFHAKVRDEFIRRFGSPPVLPP